MKTILHTPDGKLLESAAPSEHTASSIDNVIGLNYLPDLTIAEHGSLLKDRSFPALLLCTLLLIQPFLVTLPAIASVSRLTAKAAQSAEILGCRNESEQILAIRSRGVSDNERHQLSYLRSRVLRKILQGVLQVQAAENQLESELAYTYDVASRVQRKTETVSQFFNVLNFTQLGILYGIIEPYSRIHKQFKQSAIGTCVGSGMAITLPVLNIMYNKYFDRAWHPAPPSFLSHLVTGKPVDGADLPPLVVRYLNTPAFGSSLTRKQDLNELWKKRYRADMDKRETLAGIDDGKPKRKSVLNKRIVLLWSLFTSVQDFDKGLVALLNEVSQQKDLQRLDPNTRIGNPTGLTPGADEAARLLGLESAIAEFKALKDSGDSQRRIELELEIMESVLSGFLDMQIAIERCQEELNYQYDVVLAQMTARRGSFLQKTYYANFIQTGTLGACAGWSYLNGYSKAGNELFLVENSVGLGITTMSLLAGHGGWRKNETPPNSLADFFDLRSKENYGYSPLVWNFLNYTKSNGKSRREELEKLWAEKSITRYDLSQKRNLEKLGSMPSCKWDTIKLVRNRIALLTSLSEKYSHFDGELLELMHQALPPAPSDFSSGVTVSLNPLASATARLLGVNEPLTEANNRDDLRPGVQITKRILEGFLEGAVDTNLIGHEIVVESQALNSMTRRRDLAVQLTNVANFYQIGILGIVSDALGLSSDSTLVLYGDRINLVSGGLILGLAAGGALEQQGGVRLSKVLPNHLGSAFGINTTSTRLSPLMAGFLKAHSPYSTTNLSRQEELMKYWKESKVLSINASRPSNMQKLSAEGKAHHLWSETIKLINNRLTMLYDLRAMLRSSNVGLYELLKAVD